MSAYRSAAASVVVCIVVTAALAGCQAAHSPTTRPVVHGDPSGIPVKYALAHDGPVSLAAYDATGKLLRELLRAQPQKAGEYTVYWDSLDQSCRPVKRGDYQWKLLQTPAGLTTEYLMMLGTNGQPDYISWPGDHGGPSAVAVGEDGMYLGAGCGETVPTLIKQTLDGKQRLWTHHGYEAWQGAAKLELSDGKLFMLQGNGRVQVLNPADGSKLSNFMLSYPVLRLDFNHSSSVTEEGWRPVTLAAYSKEVGYGWEDASQLYSGDSATGSAMERDFHGSTAPKEQTFLIDLRDGSYNMKVYWGDAKAAHTDMSLGLNDKWERTNVSTQAGEIKTSNLGVQVTNGRLKLKFGNKPGAKPDWVVNGIEFYNSAARTATRDKQFVACFPADNVLQWIDPADGKVIDSMPIDRPQDLTIAPDGSLLVVLKDKVVSVSKQNRAPKDRITGLTAPMRITTDPVTADILLSERGESHQIKRYNSSFELIQTYGKKGGRPAQGLYDQPTSFRDVDNLAGDGHGGFLITEGTLAPRRTAHFNAKGELIREWYGGQQFFQYACPDPENPNLVWMDSQWGWLMQVQADYVKKTWKVRSTYSYTDSSDGLYGSPKLFGGWHVVHRNKQTFLWADFGYPKVLRIDEANRRAAPFAAAGVVDVGDARAPKKCPKSWLDALKAKGLDPDDFKVRSTYRAWTWADTNANGQMDGDEFRLVEATGQGFNPNGTGYTLLDDGWHVYQGSSTKDMAYQILPNLGWTPTGAPIWDWTKLQRVSSPSLPGSPAHVYKESENAVYLIMKGGGEGYPHGQTWSADLNDGTAVVKVNAKGNVLWQVGPHATRKDAPPGQLHDPIRILGKTHGCLVVGQRIIDPAEVWTDDGLYVGGAFRRRADDGLPERLYRWWRQDWDKTDGEDNRSLSQYDCLAGGAIHTFPNGEVYWYAPGWNMNPVYRLTGWDNWQRQQGTITVGEPLGLKAEYFNNRALAGTPALSRIDKQIFFNWADRSPDEPTPNEVRDRENEWKTAVKTWESKKGDKGPKPTSQPFPQPAITRDDFSVRWTGFVQAPLSEEFTFSTYNNDGVRLWVDGKLIIDDWKDWSGQEQFHYSRNELMARSVSRPIALKAGRRYAIRLEYYEGGPVKANSQAQVHLNWESPTLQRQHIPAEALFPAGR